MTNHRIGQAFSAGEIRDKLSATLVGDADRIVHGSEFLERATKDELTFVGGKKNFRRISSSEALVIIAPKEDADALTQYSDRTFLLVDEPEVAFLHIAMEITPPRKMSRTGISSRAVISESASIGAHTTIRDFVTIGDDVQIGDNCDIGVGAVIQGGCVLGDDVVLDPYVVLYPDITIGSQVRIQAGSVLGGDGFGYRTVDGGHEWLPHVGTVHICDDVQIGANTIVDRAKMGETRIGTGSRLDSLVMVAHNCQIGEHNLIVSQVGIAGSASTGNYVILAGQVGIADHVTLGDHSVVGAKSGVYRDLKGGASYLGSPAHKADDALRTMTTLPRLPAIRESVRQLEKQVADLQAQIGALTAQQSSKEAA